MCQNAVLCGNGLEIVGEDKSTQEPSLLLDIMCFIIVKDNTCSHFQTRGFIILYTITCALNDQSCRCAIKQHSFIHSFKPEAWTTF